MSPQTLNAPRSCGTPRLDRALREQAQYQIRRDQADLLWQSQQLVDDPDPARVLKIRTVVHVVYQDKEFDLGEDVIDDQMRVLNTCFAGANVKFAMPPEFAEKVGTPNIEFVVVDVTENQRNVNAYSEDDANPKGRCVKLPERGGVAGENPDTHLNIWVCALGKDHGYGTFPGTTPRELDGVVIDNRSFGLGDHVQARYNRGHTAVHEVGHWLDLLHIWGDEAHPGDDLISDTPPAQEAHTGRPSLPCNHGEMHMHMNFMDLVDDAAMWMFTKEQVKRMRLALRRHRPGVLL